MMETATSPIYWMGGIRTSNNWKWITGEDFIYTNWYPSLPNNVNSIEWFLNVYSNTANITTGSWNDLDSNKLNLSAYKDTSGFILELELDINNCNHHFTEWEEITEANCFGDGEDLRYCSYCGFEENRISEQVEHNFIFKEETGMNTCEHCGAVMYKGRIYAIFTDTVSWFDAYERCENMGGHLATITSVEEQTFVESFMKTISFSSRAWLGGFSDGTRWRWVTGEDFEKVKGEFADCAHGTEYFLEINYNKFGQWNDLTPTSKLCYICEWETE